MNRISRSERRRFPPIWDEEGYESEATRVIGDGWKNNHPIPEIPVYPEPREPESRAAKMADFRDTVYGMDCYKLATAPAITREGVILVRGRANRKRGE